MANEFSVFNFKSKDELLKKMNELDIKLPFESNTEVLKKEQVIGDKTVKNSMVILPMEGCDSNIDGSPTKLVYRRYERFAKGGSGVLWMEACAVCKGGRANPRQMHINRENVGEFKKLTDHIRKSADGSVYLVAQLTHSGRYARPDNDMGAVIAYKNAHLDRFLPNNVHIITDEEAKELEGEYVRAAMLAKEAGFDAVDVKCCHRYLLSEFLSAYNRDGEYGGSFENRTRLFFDIIRRIKESCDIDIAVRLGAYDEIPYPDGFGVDIDDFRQVNLDETKKIVRILRDLGVKMINVTGGNPYYNPHVNRPYDVGPYRPPVHQLNYVYKLLNAARELKQEVPEMTIVATGFSWLREYGANIAAGCIKNGWFDMAGFGRQAFAYPDFASDIIKDGTMYRNKCCVACSKCTVMMRDGMVTGCSVRDSEVYLPIYNQGRNGKQSAISNEIRENL
ncbi:MAG: NADH:flavin oxidoreductase [Clostridia bacterium]|nr:NADH:flavin oxidoreductase [Clostridia bacterium]